LKSRKKTAPYTMNQKKEASGKSIEVLIEKEAAEFEKLERRRRQ